MSQVKMIKLQSLLHGKHKLFQVTCLPVNATLTKSTRVDIGFHGRFHDKVPGTGDISVQDEVVTKEDGSWLKPFRNLNPLSSCKQLGKKEGTKEEPGWLEEQQKIGKLKVTTRKIQTIRKLIDGLRLAHPIRASEGVILLVSVTGRRCAKTTLNSGFYNP